MSALTAIIESNLQWTLIGFGIGIVICAIVLYILFRKDRQL